MASSLTDGLTLAQRDQFRVLRQRFVVGLPARWLELQNAPSWQARQSALHRLAGSAGSYGFERLQQASRAAELLPTDTDSDTLARALSAVAAAMAGAREEATGSV